MLHAVTLRVIAKLENTTHLTFPLGNPSFLQDIFERHHDKGLREGSHYFIDVRVPQNDGTNIWIEARSETVFDDSGTLIMLRGTAQDITVRKEADIKVKSSETILRTLIQSVPDLVWLKDVDGIYLSCNQKFERFFGYEETSKNLPRLCRDSRYLVF